MTPVDGTAETIMETCRETGVDLGALTAVGEGEAPATGSTFGSQLGQSSSTQSSETDQDVILPTASMSVMEEGHRGRRARSSVNYKEPSLTK